MRMKNVLAMGAALAVAASSSLSYGGGSNYGVQAGVPKSFSGQVREWPVPTPEFARDPAVAPDGSIYIAVMHGNKIARFDPKAQAFREWELPPGAKPHGLLVDRQGIVWYTGNGNGTIGRLDPKTGKVTEYRAPTGGDPHTLVIDKTVIWFTVQSGGRIGRLETATGKITEYSTSGGPYGIALDKQGNVWFCRMRADKLGILDPSSGELSELAMAPGSRPRRMATAPDGTLWVTLYGAGKLVQIDPVGRRMIREVPLPAGERGGAYAVTVDGAGVVWVNEINTDTVVRLDPKKGQLRVVDLPSRGVGIRKMIVDADGRLWYMGSHNGRLGVVQ
jgi:virginiamycin B lyase